MEHIGKYTNDLQEQFYKMREGNGWKRNGAVDVDCESHGKSSVMTWIDPKGEKINAYCYQCKQIEREIEDQAKKTQEAEERKKRDIENRLNRAMIPYRFQGKKLSDFVVTGDEEKRVLSFFKFYAENFKTSAFETGQSIILSGGPGTGKTHLSVGVANHVIENGGTAIFTTVTGLVRRVRESWGSKSENEQDVIDIYSMPHLLIIDEIGVQSGTDNEHQILFDIMNNRYENMLPTILLTNLPILDIRKPNGDVEKKGLQGFIGDRVLDRMREGGGKAFTLNWASYRANKSNESPAVIKVQV